MFDLYVEKRPKKNIIFIRIIWNIKNDDQSLRGNKLGNNIVKKPYCDGVSFIINIPCRKKCIGET